MLTKLTKLQIGTLKKWDGRVIAGPPDKIGTWHYNWSRWREAREPRIDAKLCMHGLLERMRQSEQTRGERREYYWLYSLTMAGRAEIEQRWPVEVKL